MISQAKPLKKKTFLPFNFAITKICVAVRLAEDGARIGDIQLQLSSSNEYTNDPANAVKLNQHRKMDAETVGKALNEIMVYKTCNGSVSILENRNCHEGLVTKLVLR